MDSKIAAEMECPCCRDGSLRDDDGTTVAVKEMELYQQEDWEELVALRKRILDRHPREPYCMLRLAEAYSLAGDPARSLEAAARGHAEDPEDLWLQAAVLEALFALGRSEHDFEWRCETPTVLRLDDRLMARIEERLRRDDRGVDDHPGMVDVGLVYYELQEEGYLAFGPREFLAAVQADPRFVVDGEPGRPWGSYFFTESFDGPLPDRSPSRSAGRAEARPARAS